MAGGEIELLLATGNAGKVREFRRLLGDLPGVVLRTLSDLPAMPEPEETGATFEENASIKARAAAEATGMMVLADDSGLEVDALDGRPGVRSARYAGPGASDADNNALLLQELSDVPEGQRTARYRVVLALVDPGGPLGRCPHYARGACEGRIGRVPRGEGGFGYDPIFEPDGHDCTMAELSPTQKSAIDHRGEATAAMRVFLSGYLARR